MTRVLPDYGTSRELLRDFAPGSSVISRRTPCGANKLRHTECAYYFRTVAYSEVIPGPFVRACPSHPVLLWVRRRGREICRRRRAGRRLRMRRERTLRWLRLRCRGQIRWRLRRRFRNFRHGNCRARRIRNGIRSLILFRVVPRIPWLNELPLIKMLNTQNFMACLLAFPNRLDEYPRQWVSQGDRTTNERKRFTYCRSEYGSHHREARL